MKKIKIFDVAFDVVTKQEALKKILAVIDTPYQKIYGVTPNPEMLLEARENPLFREVLNHAFVSIPDGIGILWASTFLENTKRNRSRIVIILKGLWYLLSLMFYPPLCRKVFPERVAGVDLFTALVSASARKHFKIFLLGAAPGVAEKVKVELEHRYHAHVVGTYAGSPSNDDFSAIAQHITRAEPDLLFVAFGAPAQEIWISTHMRDFPSVSFFMGVGGTFDFIAGAKKRAPRWMQKLGLEWLSRVLQQPSRITRIFNATIKFPWLIFWSRLK